MESHYEVLGVSADADLREVRRAYRDLLKDHHPDQGGSRERFLRIKEAYEEITGEAVPDGRRWNGDSFAATGADDPTFELADEDAAAAFGTALTVRGSLLTLSLTALVQDLELASIVDGPALRADVRRPVAFFEVRNEGDRPLSWRGRERTSFIGDDGFLYQGSSIVGPRADDLPGRWCARVARVLPGRGLHAVVVAQEVPPAVTVEKVVYAQHAYGPDGEVAETERYLFEIKDRVRGALDRLPFD